MNPWAYKSMMYGGSALTAIGMAAVAADLGTAGSISFGGGFLILLAGAVGYLWNRE